ncbi:MAG: hypothetical protein L0Y44_09090 [Phycisphaerales bacterium]|nr:hypothetical protein [Phycisphaerales bacterium]MCI0630792.1 hypothetical protein [Phycisphaerales bacterium]MCI0674216.1 hypothetical protein [Phycisphaerales bacterium]
MSVADAITSISVAIAAMSLVVGVSAWRREFVGKRRIELAESVLEKFYEAADAIRAIRNPFAHTEEGKSRKRDEGELDHESTLLDRAYRVFERYQKHETLFADLRAMRYRFMAVFGKMAGEPFDDLNKILNEIFAAAQMLGTHYWPRQGRVQMSPEEQKEHLEGKHSLEAVFWHMGEKNDAITPRVNVAVEKVEAITRKVVEQQVGWWRRLWR